MIRLMLVPGLLILGTPCLSGCPTPPEPTPPGGGPGGAGPPGANQPPPPQAGSDHPSPGGLAPTATGQSGPPSFGSLIKEGDPTITVTVRVEGLEVGQVDFQTFQELGGTSYPQVLHVEPVKGAEPIKVTAPASYDGEIFVAAYSYANGSRLSPEDPMGTWPEPIALDGKDLDLVIKIGDIAPWHEPPPGDVGPPPTGKPPASAEPVDAAGGPAGQDG